MTGVEPYLADAEKPLIIARIQATEKQSRRKVLELPYSKTFRLFPLVLNLGDSLSTVDGDTRCQHEQQSQDRQHGPPSEEFDDGAGQQTADDLSAYEEELALASGRRHFVGGIRAHQQHRALVVAECPGDGDAQQCHRDERSVLT